MPRTIDATLKTWLDTIPLLESHSTFKVSLPFTENSDIFYYATLPVNVGGQVYDRPLKSIGELKLSMGRAADRVEVRLSNEDGLNGGIFIQSRDAVRGSRVEIGRYYRNPQSPTTDYHVILFKGTIVSVSVDDRDIILTVVSDLYAGGMIGATRVVATSCQFVFKDSATCGYVGAETVCNKRFTDAGGCSGRANQHRYGGALKRNTQAGLQTVSGGLPAVNQLVKSTNGVSFTSFVQRAAIALKGGGITDDAANNATILDFTNAGRTYAINVKSDPGLTVQAIGDGVANDTAAIQQAISLAVSTGRAVYFPAGTYLTDTITGLTFQVLVFGDGSGRSVLKARTANQSVIEITGQTCHTIAIESLTIEGTGSGSGANGHGIYVHDNSFEAYNLALRNLTVINCGGRGVYLAQHFFTLLDRVYVHDCGDNGIELQGNNTCRLVSCYVHGVPAGKAAYRIYAGWPVMDSCNGLDSAGSWGVFGREFSEDGADNYCFPTIRGCNIEGWGLTQDTVAGIRFKIGSYPSWISSTTFYAGASGTNLMAIKMDFVDAANAPILDSSVQFYAAVITQFKNSQPVHSNGVPFVVFGSPISSYRDTSANADRTLPTIKSNLIAGSANAALHFSRAKIAALEASVLVGDLSGGVDFAGNAARLLLKPGTAGRPAIVNVDDTDTGVHFATDEVAITINGDGKYSFHSNYLRANAPIGVNTFPGSGYSLHTTGGVGLIDNTGGGGAPTLELKNGTNPHLLVNDAVNGLIGRLGTLNTVNQVFAGSMSNHDFLIFVNGAESWRFRTTGHFTPGAAGTQDVGTASLPIRDVNLSRNIVFPSGVRQTFAPNATNAGVNVGTLAGDPSSAANGDYWYNSATGKQRTRENGVNKDVVITGGGNLSGTLTNGRVALSGGTNTVTDSANLTFDTTSLIVAKAGGNPNIQLIDSTSGITCRLGPLAGAPDRGATGTFSNHPFVVYVNSAESWQFNTSHHLTPMTDNSRDLGAAATRCRTGYFATSVITPLASLEARTDPGSPANGDAWTSSDRNAVSVRIAGQTEDVVTSMWRNSAAFSFDTTTTETSMLSDTGVGTKTLAANRPKVGNQVRVKMAGTYGAKATSPGNFTIKLKNGATTMATISAFALPANVADQNWWIEATGTVTATGGTGTILWTINFYYNDGTGTLKGRPYTVNSSTIDTTATNLIDVTGQFTVSDAANFWETVTASIEMVA